MTTPTATSVQGINDTDKGMAILAHMSSLLASIFSVGILSFAGPLIIWFMAGPERPFVRKAAASSFNFNLGIWLLCIVGWLMAVGGIVGTRLGQPEGITISLLGLAVVGISMVLQFVCHILGIIAAARLRDYNYPMRLRVLPE